MNNTYIETEKYDGNEGDRIVKEIEEMVLNGKAKNDLIIKRIIASAILELSFLASYNLFGFVKTTNYEIEQLKGSHIEKIYNVYDFENKKSYVFTEDNIRGLIANKIYNDNKIVLDNKAKELKNKAILYLSKENGLDVSILFGKYLKLLNTDEINESIHIYVKNTNKDYKIKDSKTIENYLIDNTKDEVLVDTKNMSAFEIQSISLDDITRIKISFNGGVL